MAYPISTSANGLEDYNTSYPQSSVTSSEDYMNSATDLRTSNNNINDSISSTSGSTITVPNFTSTQRIMASRSSMSQQSNPYQQQYYPVQQQLSAQRPSTAGDRISSTRRFTTNTVPPMPVVSQLTTEPQQRRNVNDTSSDLSSAVSFAFSWNCFLLTFVHILSKSVEKGKAFFISLILSKLYNNSYPSNLTTLILIAVH